MPKHYSNGQGLNAKLLSGINKLADNVGSTLGPKGRNVILFHKEQNTPVITKDGVTIAKFVEFEDPFENVGAQIVKQAAEQSANNAGDGTTTTTVLARGIINRAQKYITAGVSPIELKRGMDITTEALTARLKDMARPIQSEEDIRHVATISANNDIAIGTLIAKAVDCAGKDGSVIVEEARSIETSLDLIEGFRFDSGYLASAFITDERSGTVAYENPLILVTDQKIEYVDQILPTLELAARENRPLLIIATDVENQALAALIMNTVRGSLKVAAVKAPRYGEERRNIISDLCISIGATCISRENSLRLKDVKLNHFGNCKKISINKGWTTIIGGKGDQNEIDKQIETIKAEIKNTESLKECERHQERITRLASGVAVIRVGAATEVEMIEKKHRIDDALEAVRSAQMEGIVSGGGSALIHAAKSLIIDDLSEEQALGRDIILDAVREPLRQMATNAGLSPDLIVNEVINSNEGEGYDFMTNEVKELSSFGIIDPTKVTRCAIENAVSVASTLLTTGHAIVSQ